MGYGVIAEFGGSHLIWIPHDPHYGETRTEVVDMSNLYNDDVSVHCSLATVDLYQATRADNYSVGIMGYVKDGDWKFQTTDPGRWPTFLYDVGISFVRFAYHLSVNGGYIKGSHFIQFWGDPDPRSGREQVIGEERMLVVFEPESGNIRHTHRRLVGTGAETQGGPEDEPIDVARELGHEGPLDVAEFVPQEMGPDITNINQLSPL
jgi:hypothetical protein